MLRNLTLFLFLLQSTAVVASDWKVLSDQFSITAGNAQKHAVVSRQSPEAQSFATQYDLEVSFTRQNGNNSIAIFFPTPNGMASLDIDGWGQGLSGVQQINGQDMRAYADQVKRLRLQNGRQYTALIAVRSNHVSTHLDDQELMSVDLASKQLSIPPVWQAHDSMLIGVGAWQSQAKVHQIRYRPVLEIEPPVKVQKLVQKNNLIADNLKSLSDEFDSPASLSNWQRVFRTEKTQADQLQSIDINRSRQGWLTMQPYTSSWYQDWRGVLMYKPVRGDFIVSTKIHATSRRGTGAPNSLFSLAGIMIRTPRNITPQNWRPGNENYIFLSFGSADKPGRYQYEVKTTVNSDSRLEITPARTDTVEIRAVRIGGVFILLNRINGQWRVHRRYHRADMPEELQVGMTVYTDWNNVEKLSPQRHNTTVIHNGNPDLVAGFDFMRFQRPDIPAELKTQNLMTVSDRVLLEAFGFDQ